MEAMSSADFAPKEEPVSSPSKGDSKKLTDTLNKSGSKDNEGSSSGFAAKKVPTQNTF